MANNSFGDVVVGEVDETRGATIVKPHHNKKHTIDYRVIYPLFSENIKLYLPQSIVGVIYEYLYSPKDHFLNYVKRDLWKQCWIRYKKHQIHEIQFLLDFLFDLRGMTGYHYSIDAPFDIRWSINNYVPGDVSFEVDYSTQFDSPITHITVRFENHPTSYFYVMNNDAYDKFCYYDGCHRYYWMFDVYETDEFHLLQATVRHLFTTNYLLII